MAGKKNFENIDTRNTRTPGKVAEAMSQATSKYGQQPAAGEEEARQRRQKMQTQGRKGVKLHRINMGFSDDNYEFLSIISKQKGLTMTRFLNCIVDEYRANHGATEEVLAQIKELVSKL